jgi:hypothetical protein
MAGRDYSPDIICLCFAAMLVFLLFWTDYTPTVPFTQVQYTSFHF